MTALSACLQPLLNAGEFLVSAELTPPRHYDTTENIGFLELLKQQVYAKP